MAFMTISNVYKINKFSINQHHDFFWKEIIKAGKKYKICKTSFYGEWIILQWGNSVRNELPSSKGSTLNV